MPRRGDLMLGAGGVPVRPLSESDVLTQIIQNITHGDYRDALDAAKELRRQVLAGYHTNPYAPFKVVGPIGQNVHEIRYQHAEDGKFYKHEFAGDVEVLAIERHGKKELLLVHKRGLPLWEDF